MSHIGPCLCGDPECPSCGPAQGFTPGMNDLEQCPVCGKDLYTDGDADEPASPDTFPFCSVACQDKYEAELAAADEAYYRDVVADSLTDEPSSD